MRFTRKLLDFALCFVPLLLLGLLLFFMAGIAMADSDPCEEWPLTQGCSVGLSTAAPLHTVEAHSHECDDSTCGFRVTWSDTREGITQCAVYRGAKRVHPPAQGRIVLNRGTRNPLANRPPFLTLL